MTIPYTQWISSEETRNGGAAAVIIGGPPAQPEVLATIKAKGRTCTNSHEEEAAAMESALMWTSTTGNYESFTIFIHLLVLICTFPKSFTYLCR